MNIPNFVTRKKKGKALWSYDKMLISEENETEEPRQEIDEADRGDNMYLLTEWEGRTGKYLALGHGARTSLRSVRTP